MEVIYMDKKGIVCIILFCILTLVPLTTALSSTVKSVQDDQNEGKNKFFTNCYITANGDISTKDWPRIIGSNMWKHFWLRPFNDDRAVVSYWQLVFDVDAELTVYDEQDGAVLYHHSNTDHQQLRLIGYYGQYIPTVPEGGSGLHITIDGKTLFLLITDR